MEKNYNTLQLVKRRMFAMRNGVVADVLRKGGSPFRIIFGLNLPQLVEIAQEFGKDRALALTLWANGSTRESMLLAPMLMPVDGMPLPLAREWCSEVPSAEVADILCHRLLKHMDYAPALAAGLAEAGNTDLERYTGVRLAFNIYMRNPQAARQVVDNALQWPQPLSSRLAATLKEELEYC